MKKRIISIDVNLGTYSSFIDRLVALAEYRKSSYTCVANVHMCIEAADDPAFAQVVNEADIVTPDGMPLAKGLKFIYGRHQDRVAGMDLLPDLLKLSEVNKLKVFFYGGTQTVQDATHSFVKKHYPALVAVGFYSPPFRPLSMEEEEETVKKINATGTHFVFVALGCPKQEKWMASMKGRINACMIGIGGALPVMIGHQRRAPKWMQRASLEWLYRLYQEPKRLFKRYAYTNTKFVALLMREKFQANKK